MKQIVCPDNGEKTSNKHTPMRMCIVCRQMKPKVELVRIVKLSDNSWQCDTTGKAQCRGLYICRNKQCLSNAIKNKKLAKFYGTQFVELLQTILSEVSNEQ